MADTRIEYRHPTTRGLTTLYAVLRVGSECVRASDGALVAATEGGWAAFAHPMSDADVPYLYVGAIHPDTPVRVYDVAVFPAASPGTYDIDDDLIAQGPLDWRGPAGTSSPPATGAMADLRAEIVTRLGGNTLDVELTEADLTLCVRDALRVLNRERPPTAWGTFTNDGTGRFKVTAPGLYGVIDVDWATGGDCDPGCGDVFNQDSALTTLGLDPFGRGGLMGERMQDVTYRAMNDDIAGRSPDWEARWVRRQSGADLYIVLSDIPSGAGIMYEYAWHLTADDDPATGVSNIPPNDAQWVVEYATAKAKLILARVLSKYGGGINMPDGSTEQLDGDTLRQQADADIQQLTAEMRERRRPMLPRTG